MKTPNQLWNGVFQNKTQIEKTPNMQKSSVSLFLLYAIPCICIHYNIEFTYSQIVVYLSLLSVIHYHSPWKKD